MKKNWKKMTGVLCVGGLLAVCLAGCGKDEADSIGLPVQEIQQDNMADKPQEDQVPADQENHEPLEEDNKKTADSGSFFDGASLQGSVVEFSDEGFSLSPATTEKEDGGGEVMAQAAPGSESDENNIQITYTDETEFQIVNLSISSQSEVSREGTDKESVKKQSDVCVFGSCQDTYHWTADKILILRWQ